jgi:hypothetical protein
MIGLRKKRVHGKSINGGSGSGVIDGTLIGRSVAAPVA